MVLDDAGEFSCFALPVGCCDFAFLLFLYVRGGAQGREMRALVRSLRIAALFNIHRVYNRRNRCEAVR